MKITSSRAKIVKTVMEEWVREEMITRDEGTRLLQSCEVVAFDWKRATKYSFWLALICIVIAVCSLLADEALLELIAGIFKAPAFVKNLCSAAVAFAFYLLGFRTKRDRPEKIFSIEAIFFLGILSTAGCVFSSARRLILEAGISPFFFCYLPLFMLLWASSYNPNSSGSLGFYRLEAGLEQKPAIYRAGAPIIWA